MHVLLARQPEELLTVQLWHTPLPYTTTLRFLRDKAFCIDMQAPQETASHP